MSYLISSANKEKQLSINYDVFIKRLSDKWPEVTINYVNEPDSFYKIEWKLSPSPTAVEGRLDNRGESMVIDGQWDDCIAFALWVRTQIPETDRLLFYDDGFNNSIELKTETTEGEIDAAFSI